MRFILYKIFVCPFSPRYGREKPDKVQGWDRAVSIHAFNLHRFASKVSIDTDRTIPRVGAAEKTGGAHFARRGLRSEGEPRAHAYCHSVSSRVLPCPFKRRAPVNRMLCGVNRAKELTASLLYCTAAGGACSERESELLRDSLSLQATAPAGICYKKAFRRAFDLTTQGSA